MIELKTQLVLAFAWIVLCFTVGKCSVYPNSTYFQECERQCHKPPKDSRVSEQNAESRCIRECLVLKAKENATATVTPKTANVSVNLTTATSGRSPTTKGQRNSCPRSYKPAPNEEVPGDVTDLTVTFVHEKKGATKAWVANVSWTAPKGVNASINWNGYLVVWFSMSDSQDAGPKPVLCRKVPKSQTHIVINETDGWKYPRNLYLAVLALPSYEERTELKTFRPWMPEWRVPGLYKPASIKEKGGKAFQLWSPEGIAISVVTALVIILAIIWVVNIYVFKRKKSKSFHVSFSSGNEKKTEEKKEDELKHQLIV